MSYDPDFNTDIIHLGKIDYVRDVKNIPNIPITTEYLQTDTLEIYIHRFVEMIKEEVFRKYNHLHQIKIYFETFDPMNPKYNFYIQFAKYHQIEEEVIKKSIFVSFVNEENEIIHDEIVSFSSFTKHEFDELFQKYSHILK